MTDKATMLDAWNILVVLANTPPEEWLAKSELHEQIAAWRGKTTLTGLKMRSEAHLGHGSLAISTGTFHDVPAVFIEKAPEPGQVGANVPRKVREEIGLSAEDAIVITHPKEQVVYSIAELMCGDSLMPILVVQDEGARRPSIQDGLAHLIVTTEGKILKDRDGLFEGAGLQIVPRKLLAEAHAVMRACGWQIAPLTESKGDGVLEMAAAEVEDKFAKMLGGGDG